MKYISTRGNAQVLDFEQVLLTGLATDGGLYVPETLPSFSHEKIASWAGLGYSELAFEIIAPFVDGCIDDADLRAMLDDTYAGFAHPAVAPLVQLENNEWVLELFQGPTLAFKDFALQLLGRMLDHILTRRGEHAVVMGATSGDTGSAAIEGCRRCSSLDIFILHPHQRVSDVQRRQMTTVLSPSVHNIALRGNFDDCQNIVKASFSDQSFLPGGMRLIAVNSINWARIMAQIVYYFYAAIALGGPHRAMAFSVPTGNFGDIFAGYLACKMGLPIDRLIIATNQNDVLHRALSDGVYQPGALQPSLSPSMDISISSNFERLLFDLYGRNGKKIDQMMKEFSAGSMPLDASALTAARTLFASARVDDQQTCQLISDVYNASDYLLDPHSAVGVDAARKLAAQGEVNPLIPMISLATAHPAKFPQAIEQSGLGVKPVLPPHLRDLFERDERYDVLDNDRKAVNNYMATQLAASKA